MSNDAPSGKGNRYPFEAHEARRKGDPLVLISVRLPDHLLIRIDDEAARRDITRTDLIIEALEKSCKGLVDDRP